MHTKLQQAKARLADAVARSRQPGERSDGVDHAAAISAANAEVLRESFRAALAVPSGVINANVAVPKGTGAGTAEPGTLTPDEIRARHMMAPDQPIEYLNNGK